MGTHHWSKQPIRVPDDPHITVQMMSTRFPSTNCTLHINTSTADPEVRNPGTHDDMRKTKLYPNGFPYHLLVGHLNQRSRGYETPKQRYESVYKKEMEKRKMEKRRQQRMSKKGTCGAAGK